MTNEQRQKRVLYAEASDLVQASHGLALQSLDCYVVQVASAAAALEALSSEEPFDIILVGDVSKSSQGEAPEPELSVIKKAKELYPQTPVLIFTSHDYLTEAYQAGISGDLKKPAGGFVFINFIAPYLTSSSSRKSSETDSGGTAHHN
jgi:DNA-binding NarL/FixJ family response regulator